MYRNLAPSTVEAPINELLVIAHQVIEQGSTLRDLLPRDRISEAVCFTIWKCVLPGSTRVRLTYTAFRNLKLGLTTISRKLIFNQEYFNDTLASLDYDNNKMPLGKLSKRTLLRGYEVLKELATLVQNQGTAPAGHTWIEDVTNLSNTYFSLIPHAIGFNRAPVLQNMIMIKKEIDLLETLTDMQLANEIMKSAKGSKEKDAESNVMDRQYQGLGMQEMAPLDLLSPEAVELSDYLNRSSGATHNIKYKVQDIFRIERQGENDRFSQSEYSKIKNSDRRLLWHGSRVTNFGKSSVPCGRPVEIPSQYSASFRWQCVMLDHILPI